MHEITQPPSAEPAEPAAPAENAAAPLESAVAPAAEAAPQLLVEPGAGVPEEPAAASTTPQEPAPEPAPAPVAALAPELSPAACAALLAERFPALFGAGRALPIKLRIQADIQARAPGVFSRKSLSIFLHRHTTTTAYLKALVHATQRCDLDGAAAGEVSEEHRLAAGEELERRRGIAMARRAAEQDAQRAAAAAEREKARQEQAALAAQHAAENEGRRERATLLRAYETSTLTRANFCALKGLAEAALEAQLQLAREERAQRPPPPPAPEPAPPRRDDRRGGPGQTTADARDPRRAGGGRSGPRPEVGRGAGPRPAKPQR
jgi:sRNA-binding protein